MSVIKYVDVPWSHIAPYLCYARNQAPSTLPHITLAFSHHQHQALNYPIISTNLANTIFMYQNLNSLLPDEMMLTVRYSGESHVAGVG